MPSPTPIVVTWRELGYLTVIEYTAGQPTSVDLVLFNQADKPVFLIEAKLVETEFGGCSVFAAGDCDGRNPALDLSQCYLHHLGRRYWTLLEKHGFLSGPLRDSATCLLASYYQFFREVLFALELDGTFVLLCDARNLTLACDAPQGKRSLLPFLCTFVPEALRRRVAMVTIQQIMAAIKHSSQYPWIDDFERKYGLP